MAKRSYQQFCPVARTMDLLGERWTILIVRELLTGPLRYTDLRDRLPGLWSNLLGPRLRDLEAAGVVARRELPAPAARTVYELTERGRALGGVIHEIARWGLPLLDTPTADQPLLPHLVPLGLEALVRLEWLPDRPLTAVMITDQGDVTLRIVGPDDAAGRRRPLHTRVTTVPGATLDPDVRVRADVAVLLWLRRGEISYDDARADGLIEVDGDRAAVAALERLLGLTDSRA